MPRFCIRCGHSDGLVRDGTCRVAFFHGGNCGCACVYAADLLWTLRVRGTDRYLVSEAGSTTGDPGEAMRLAYGLAQQAAGRVPVAVDIIEAQEGRTA